VRPKGKNRAMPSQAQAPQNKTYRRPLCAILGVLINSLTNMRIEEMKVIFNKLLILIYLIAINFDFSHYFLKKIRGQEKNCK